MPARDCTNVNAKCLEGTCRMISDMNEMAVEGNTLTLYTRDLRRTGSY
jgi:hypothetical protein